jgi:hypothetical protein
VFKELDYFGQCFFFACLILVTCLQAEAVSRVMAVAASTADSNDMSDILFHDSTASVADFNRIIRQVLRVMEIGVPALDCAPWPKVLELAKQKGVSKEGILIFYTVSGQCTTCTRETSLNISFLM